MMMIPELPTIKQEPTLNAVTVQQPITTENLFMYDKDKKVTKYKCDICDKHFAKKPTLKLHMRLVGMIIFLRPPSVPDGLGVRIPDSHSGGPGSIPGQGEFLIKLIFLGRILANVLITVKSAVKVLPKNNR